MANDKYYGYSPKKETRKPSTGVTDVGTRLDRVNPYEFRKGMDVELTSLGVSRLAESTPEEREKATETVLKNLEEHQSYYSALVQFNAGMNQASPINETSFKKYLETYTSERGDGMVEVNKEIKDDKMTEPKYDSKEYTKEFKTDVLKEAIKKEVNSMLSEMYPVKEEEEKEPSKKQVKKDKKAMSLAKTKETLLNKKEDKKALETKRKDAFDAYKDKIRNLDPDKAKKELEKYKKKEAPITAKIKDIDTEIEKLNKTLEEAKETEKEMRYEVAKTMMGKDIHMEILEIIKEYGVSLKEGAEGVKMYYEIAKTAYMEGLTAGMKKNI